MNQHKTFLDEGMMLIRAGAIEGLKGYDIELVDNHPTNTVFDLDDDDIVVVQSLKDGYHFKLVMWKASDEEIKQYERIQDREDIPGLSYCPTCGRRIDLHGNVFEDRYLAHCPTHEWMMVSVEEIGSSVPDAYDHAKEEET